MTWADLHDLGQALLIGTEGVAIWFAFVVAMGCACYVGSGAWRCR